VAGSRTSVTVKSHSMKAKDITIEGLSSITLKTGSASLKMSSNGDIEISGKNITIKGSDIDVDGSGDLTLTGKNIDQN
jgi:type VI secretion system secreted protein VgrG